MSTAATSVIRQTPLLKVEGTSLDWFTIVLALIINLFLHALFIAAFWFVLSTSGSQASDAGRARPQIDTEVESPPEKPDDGGDLTNTDEGINPLVPKNNDSTRIAEITVNATKTDPTAEPGKMGTTALPPSALPTPPSFELGKTGSFDPLPSGTVNLVPGGFAARESAATRQRMLTREGGNAESEAAVARALEWLAKHQAREGYWALDRFQDNHLEDEQKGSCNCDGGGAHNHIAGTAFGLLPFLGAGLTHQTEGKEMHNYTKTIAAGLNYLLAMQKNDGAFVAAPRDRNHPHFMYAHGLATVAICEAASMAPRDERLRDAAQKAVFFIVRAQHSGGGWRYRPGETGDTSVTGWQVMALQSGKMAGLVVPRANFEKADQFLDSVQYKDGGGYGYFQERPSSEEEIIKEPTMTAVGLLCRQYINPLEWSPRREGMIKGIARLSKAGPDPRNEMNIYYYYYATQVLHHVGGDVWKDWNGKMRDLLVAKQDKGNTPGRAHQRGSWSPAGDHWGKAGGRLMMTSLACLTLEVYYRHLPLFRSEYGTK